MKSTQRLKFYTNCIRTFTNSSSLRVMNVVNTLMQVLAILFFRKKSLNMFRLNFLFRGLTFDHFFHFISFVERKAKCTIEQQKCKAPEKRDRLLVFKVDFPVEYKFYLLPQFSKIG